MQIAFVLLVIQVQLTDFLAEVAYQTVDSLLFLLLPVPEHDLDFRKNMQVYLRQLVLGLKLADELALLVVLILRLLLVVWLIDQGIFLVDGFLGSDVAQCRVRMGCGWTSDCVGLRAWRSSFMQELALVLAWVHFPQHILSLLFLLFKPQQSSHAWYLQ